MAFYVGATDVRTGRAVYHLCRDGGGEDLLWMRASASMPLVSRPVRIGEGAYLDGGIADAVPFAFMEETGYGRQVIVLTRPAGYVKRKARLLFLLRLALRRYPRVAAAMAERHEMYNRETARIAELERAGRVLAIRPEAPLGIRRTERNPEELERVYRLGRAAAEKRLPEIRSFLSADR